MPDIRKQLLLLSSLFVVACRQKPQIEATPTTTPTSVPAPVDGPAGNTPTGTDRKGPTSADDTRAREAAAAREAAVSTINGTVIYFGFDRSDLSEQAKASLNSILNALRAQQDMRVRIEGHADERGSDEYNMALGQRRAAAARRFLTDGGVNNERIRIVSYGEERPTCTEADESCWSRNRRGEFRILVE